MSLPFKKLLKCGIAGHLRLRYEWTDRNVADSDGVACERPINAAWLFVLFSTADTVQTGQAENTEKDDDEDMCGSRQNQSGHGQMSSSRFRCVMFQLLFDKKEICKLCMQDYFRLFFFYSRKCMDIFSRVLRDSTTRFVGPSVGPSVPRSVTLY